MGFCTWAQRAAMVECISGMTRLHANRPLEMLEWNPEAFYFGRELIFPPEKNIQLQVLVSVRVIFLVH